MGSHNVVLFGEAEKGEYQKGYYCESLPQLVDVLGHPPDETLGLYFAVQALLYDQSIIFFRVREEGYDTTGYMHGLHALESNEWVYSLSAIGLPGVGDAEIIHAVEPVCSTHNSILIMTESDLYDYLTGG